MIKKLKCPLALFTSLAVLLSMLMYLPSGVGLSMILYTIVRKKFEGR